MDALFHAVGACPCGPSHASLATALALGGPALGYAYHHVKTRMCRRRLRPLRAEERRVEAELSDVRGEATR